MATGCVSACWRCCSSPAPPWPGRRRPPPNGSPRSGPPGSCRRFSTAPWPTSWSTTPSCARPRCGWRSSTWRTASRPAWRDYQAYAPIYPASVVKFVYLMAAYRWQEEGRLRIEGGFDQELSEMIRQSSNQATRKVFARLTETEPGPELPPQAYRDFRERRHAVKRWLVSLGIERPPLREPDVRRRAATSSAATGSSSTTRPSRAGSSGSAPNRQAMTAIGTAKLLALLATDRALTPADSAVVRARMRRDPKEQRHLAARIAGGAARVGGLEVYAKSGTWGPIYADAGIVRQMASGRQMVIVVFTEASPAYRGDFIADLTAASAERVLGE